MPGKTCGAMHKMHHTEKILMDQKREKQSGDERKGGWCKVSESNRGNSAPNRKIKICQPSILVLIHYSSKWHLDQLEFPLLIYLLYFIFFG